jgi:hypothetical protein
MSELESVYIDRTGDWCRSGNNTGKFYLKSEADKVIAELEEERRWRKCSDEMPEDGAEVLASDGVGIWLCYKTTMSDGSPWFQPDGLPHIEGVTHWMPLPSAPKEADK